MSADTTPRGEVLRLKLRIWHPDCWTLRVTDRTSAGLLGHGVFTTEEGWAKSRFTVYGDSVEVVDELVAAARASDLTESVFEISDSYPATGERVSAPGNATREVFVEFYPENSIDSAFVSRGFLYDGPTRIRDGTEHWYVVADQDRETVRRNLEEIREEADADIEVERISTVQRGGRGRGEGTGLDRLTERQREVFEFARERDYYTWPREVTARELAEEFGVTKTTFLEHIRKAEAKLLNDVP